MSKIPFSFTSFFKRFPFLAYASCRQWNSQEELACLFYALRHISSPLRPRKRCKRIWRIDMEPFFATKKGEKVGRDGLLCLYECVSGVLQLRKIPQKSFFCFPSQLVENSLPLEKIDWCFCPSACLLCFSASAYNEEVFKGREEGRREQRVWGRLVSLYKRTALMVFSYLPCFSSFSCFGLAMFGGILIGVSFFHFLLFSSRLVQSILLSSKLVHITSCWSCFLSVVMFHDPELWSNHVCRLIMVRVEHQIYSSSTTVTTAAFFAIIKAPHYQV